MNDKKILIIIICILIILTIVVAIILNKIKKQEEEVEFIKNENPTLTTSLDVKKVENETEFFTVEQCINKYFEELDNKNSDAIYNLLDEDYIKEQNITKSNALQNVYQLQNGFAKFIVKKVYTREISYDKKYQYFVYGELLGDNYNTIQTIYILVNLDFYNNSFSIDFPETIEIGSEEYLQRMNSLINNNTNNFIEVSESSEEDIKLNSYNSFTTAVNEPKDAMVYYLNNYITMAVYYPEIAYDLLDSEYKEARFGDLEAYKKYISDNEARLLNSTINEYSISEKDEYTQYTVVDTNKNYYIFRVTDIMEYSVILDVYTVDLEEVSSQYDEFSMQEKVSVNIQKITAALNDKNYRYIYNKLDNNFKNNYYKTLEDFENYMNSQFLGKFNVSFKDFSNEGETYVYNIVLNGTTASNQGEINMQIIMQLKEDRDFVMSFSIK